MPGVAKRRRGRSPAQVAAAAPLLLLLLLACCPEPGRGAPVSPQGFQPEQELQLWNEINNACSSLLSMKSQPQETDEKDNTKRFLFHYSKTRKLGNSNVVSSVLHPLLQLVPQLHERRTKRLRADEEFQGPLASQNRRYFLFRPRNGKRSEAYI